MTNRQNVLVTGSSGFVGQSLCSAVEAQQWNVRRATQNREQSGELTLGGGPSDSSWGSALDDMDCVVHLAARTHVTRDSSPNPLTEYRRVNVDLTRSLARSAAASGVRHFVFLSSIKVNGESTGSRPFTESDIPAPLDAYGISKFEAERALWKIADETGLHVTILRSPLVYGPCVKANFLRLMRLVSKRVPLPLASIENRRSLIYLGNLVNAILLCMDQPAAAGKTYLVCDGEALSTPELIHEISRALGIKSNLFPFPPIFLELGASLLARKSEWERLSDSLTIDSSLISNELGWRPPFTLAQGLAETAKWYHSQSSD